MNPSKHTDFLTGSQVTVSAPASTMLMGEHAVMYGYGAIVAALNYRVTVNLTPREDEQIIVNSDLDTWQTTLHEVHYVVTKLTYVKAALSLFAPSLKHGLMCSIESDIQSTVGLGSSAAITVALIGALRKLCGLPCEKQLVWMDAYRVIQAVQSYGSGADCAASIWGGVIFYRQFPFQVLPIKLNQQLALLYSGSKTPTPMVIQKLKKRFEHRLHDLYAIFDTMEQHTVNAIKALEKQDMMTLGQCMNLQQKSFDDLELNTPELQNCIDDLRHTKGCLGAKISGSGMGDCAIGIGDEYMCDALKHKSNYIKASID